MASFTERIKILLELDDTGGTKALKKFRDSVKEAEGATGKFKAAAGGSMDYVKEHAGAFAAAAGTAVVAFGIKAVHAFEDTAKASINLADATGLSTEAASRWIAVGDDYQVSAEQLVAGIGKIAKSLDDSKWEKYGIETRDAAGNARDANDILIDSLSTLSAVTNGTERARMGTELFGKGYANLAPIIGHTRGEYEKMLGAVEDGQVITRAEAEKAEKMRKAEDQLSDALKNIALNAGQALAGLAPLVEKAAQLVTLAEKAANSLSDEKSFGDFAEQFNDLVPAAEKARLNLSNWFEDLRKGRKTIDEFKQAIVDGGGEVDGFTSTTEKATVAAEDNAQAVDDARNALMQHDRQASYATATEEDLAKATETATAAHQKSVDAIEAAAQATRDRLQAEQELTNFIKAQIDAHFAYYQASLDINSAVTEYNATLKDSKATSDDVARATDNVRAKAAAAAEQYAKQAGAIDGSTESFKLQRDSLEETQKSFAPGSPAYQSIQGLIDLLNSVPSEVSTRMRVQTGQTGVLTQSSTGSSHRASGGPTRAGGLYEVTEGGRSELLHEGGRTYLLAGRDGEVDPLQPIRGGGGSAGFAGGGVGFASGGGSSAGAKGGTPKLDDLLAQFAAEKHAQEQAAKAADDKKKADEDAAQAAKDAARHEEDVWAEQLARNEITNEQYIALINSRIGAYEKYSDDEDRLWHARADAQKAIDDKAADDLQAQRDKQHKIQEDAEKAHQDALDKIFEDARRKRAQEDASDAADRAMSDLAQAAAVANWYAHDKNATQAEKDQANSDLEAAKKRAAEALYRRADANANRAGLEDDTPEWASAVRAELMQDEANAPALTDAINRILDGIPTFDRGGVMPGARGRHSLAYVAGGETILPTHRDGEWSRRPTVVVNMSGVHDRTITIAAERAMREAARRASFGLRRIA